MTDIIFYPYSFLNNKIIRTEDAKVSITVNALQYGNAVFGGIRGYISHDKKSISLFRVSDHYKRFLESLKILNKKIDFGIEDLIKITVNLTRKNHPQNDCYIRPFAYASTSEISPDLSNVSFDFALFMFPFGEYLSISKGIKICVSNWIRVNDNMIPSRAKISGSYINSSLAKQDAVRNGFDDALMMTFDGHISEGTSSNFFMVKEGTLVTSPKYSDILEGITRRTIIALAKDFNISVEEREIDRTEVYTADEVFLSGTGAQIAWVSEIDGRIIGDGKIGKITNKLQNLFFDTVRGRIESYKHWLTKI